MSAKNRSTKKLDREIEAFFALFIDRFFQDPFSRDLLASHDPNVTASSVRAAIELALPALWGACPACYIAQGIRRFCEQGEVPHRMRTFRRAGRRHRHLEVLPEPEWE